MDGQMVEKRREEEMKGGEMKEMKHEGMRGIEGMRDVKI